MAYYDGYNYAYVRNDEIFDQRRTPMPFRMDLGEIVEAPEIEAYDYNNHGYNNHAYNNHGYNNHDYNNQVQQIYYNNDHDNDGRRDYDQNDRNNRGNYVLDQIPFPMARQELQEISVSIRLSSIRNVSNLMSTLYQSYEFRCSCAGNVLTVTGYPRDRALDGPNEFLNIVKRVSGDRRAYIV